MVIFMTPQHIQDTSSTAPSREATVQKSSSLSTDGMAEHQDKWHVAGRPCHSLQEQIGCQSPAVAAVLRGVRLVLGPQSLKRSSAEVQLPLPPPHHPQQNWHTATVKAASVTVG